MYNEYNIIPVLQLFEQIYTPKIASLLLYKQGKVQLGLFK